MSVQPGNSETGTDKGLAEHPAGCANARLPAGVKVVVDGKPQPLTEVAKPLDLKPGTWVKDKDGVSVCFDLPKGHSALAW